MKNSLAVCALTAALFLSNGAFAGPPAPIYSVEETTIGELLDNPKTRAVLDKTLPELSSSDQIDMARGMTLKAIQTFAPDTVTDAALAKIEADLAKLPADK